MYVHEHSNHYHTKDLQLSITDLKMFYMYTCLGPGDTRNGFEKLTVPSLGKLDSYSVQDLISGKGIQGSKIYCGTHSL